ncbi:MAG: helix-turn-helix transcriptional regulator [Erysipelothrix sp.]|nr:helix-turn-helix transcriptional regulator [Erysipelothrix sp.]
MEEKVMTSEEIEAFKKEQLSQTEYDELTKLFKMYADGTRLKILSALSKRSCSVNDLSYTLDMSQSAISHQLASLKKHNLVKSHKVGLNVFYSLADSHVMTIFQQAHEHIAEECNSFHEN